MTFNQARAYSSPAQPSALNAFITAGATTLVIASNPASLNWPPTPNGTSAPNYTLLLDWGSPVNQGSPGAAEVVLVTNVAANTPSAGLYTLTITRGQDGTTGAAHSPPSSGYNVYHGVSEQDFGDAAAHLGSTGQTTSAVTGNVVPVHGIASSSAVVGLNETQTLTNKTLTSGTNTFPTFNQNTTGSSGSCTGNSATATTAAACSGNSATATTATTAGGAPPTGAASGALSGTYPNPGIGVAMPKDIGGTAYITAGNPQGWAGSDVGAWINSAWAYLKATYGATVGGKIHIGPGVFSFTTPIVIGAQFSSVKLTGSGGGCGVNGTTNPTGTTLYYTATSGIALTIGGGSNNTSSMGLEDFALSGTGIGNGAQAVQFGAVATVGTLAGLTVKDVSIDGFSLGYVWGTGTSIAYAITFLNCKTQFCTTGFTPGGEANNCLGGLIAGNGTGVVGSIASDFNCIGTAFDDNTTTAVNSSTALFRSTLAACRFENAGGGTDTYITVSAGSVVVLGGTMQSDVTTGTSTGFVQATGGTFYLAGTWLLGQGSRVFTQAFNVSSTVTSFRADPVIASSSVGITQLFNTTTGVMPQRDSTHTQLNPTATAIPLTTVTNADSRGGFPLPAAVPSPLKVRATILCTNAATAQTLTATLHFGTANTSADATIATCSLAAGTAAVGSGKFVFEFELMTSTTALGSIVFHNGVNSAVATPVATGMSATPNQTAISTAPVTVVTTSATFIGCYLSSATAAAVTVRSVTWEIVG